MLIIIYTLLIILYLISQFAGGAALNFITGIVALIALVFSFFYAKGSYFIAGIIFLISGTILFLFEKLPWYTYILHFKPMMGLISLFLVLPFISSLLRVGHYDKNLSTLLRDKISNLKGLYTRSFIVCFILGLFLNVATLSLLITSLDNKMKQLPNNIKNQFFSQNLLRAFFLCITWSPMEIMVSLSLDITKAKYYTILPVIVFMVILAIGVDWKLASLKFKKVGLSDSPDIQINYSKIFKNTGQLVVMLIILILLISFTQSILNKGFLLSVVMVLLPFSITWTLFIGKFKRYWKIAIPNWKERTRGLSNYFFMFLSAGLFIEMLSASGFLSLLQPIFTQASKNSLVLYLIIGGYFLTTSLMGFHPLISITFLARLLQPVLSNLNPVPLTIVLISCSLAPAMYSPYNVSANIIADQLKINPYRVGFWNISFAIFYMLLSITVSFLLGLIL